MSWELQPLRWQRGSLCAQHGAYPQPACPGCPPLEQQQHRPGSASWRVLEALRLLQQHARREPVACPCGHNDVAAVRIAVRRLRGNQLT